MSEHGLSRSGRTGRAGRGLGAAALSASTGLLATLILVPTAIRILGPATYGSWALMWQIIGYVGFLDLGVAYAASRDIAAVRTSGTESEQAQILSSGFWLYAGLGLLFCAVGVGLLGLLNNWLPGPNATTTWVILVAYGGLAFPTRFLAAAGQGAQRVAAVNLVGFFQGLVNIVVSVVLLHRGFGIMALAIGILVSGLLALGLQLGVFAQTYGFAGLAPSSFRTSTARQLLSFSSLVFVTGLSWTIVSSTDTIVIGAVLGSTAVTFFVVNYRIPSQLVALLDLGADVSLPGLTEIMASGANRRSTIQLGEMMGVATGVGAAGIWVFLVPFVRLWVGSAFVPSALLVGLAGYLVIHHPAQHVFATLMTAAREVRMLAVVTAVEAAANLVLSVLLVRAIGVPGALLGTALAGLIDVGYAAPRAGRLTVGSPFTLAGHLYGAALVTSATGLLVGTLLLRIASIHSWITLIVVGIAWVGIIGLAVLVLDRVFLESRFRASLRRLWRASLGLA